MFVSWDSLLIAGSILVTAIAIFYLWLRHDRKREAAREAAIERRHMNRR